MKEVKSIPLAKDVASHVLSLLISGLVGITMLNESLKSEYVDLLIMAVAIAGIGATFWLLYTFPYKGRINFNQERLECQYLFGLVHTRIALRDISHYQRQFEYHDKDKWKILTFHSASDKIKIDGSKVKNIEAFNPLARGLKLVDSKQKNSIWGMLGMGLLLVLLSLFGFFFVLTDYYKEPSIIDSQKITVIKGTLSKELFIYKDDNIRNINIYLNEYPGLEFHLPDLHVDAARELDLVANVEPGDEMELGISIYEFRKKIQKSERLSFWEKHRNYPEIICYSVESKDQSYLNLSTLNEYRQRDKNFGSFILALGAAVLFLIIGIIMTFIGIDSSN